MRSRIVESACVLLAAVALAIVTTYPLVLRLDRAQRIDSGDGQFSVWNVAWVAHALTTDSRTLFDTNIFFPYRNTLAYSEANILPGALAAPVYWLTGSPFLAYNFSFLFGGFVAAAVCAYALARYLTGSVAAAAFAGAAYAFCPFVFARLPHIQLQFTFGIPLSLLALHYLVDGFDRRPGVRDRALIGRAALLGVALWAQALSCAYYGIFAGLVVGLGVLFYSGTRGLWRQPVWFVAVLLAAATSITLVLPFFLPYLDVQEEGFARSLIEARRYSADWRAWLVSAAHAHRWMHAYLRDTTPGQPPWKEVLFPGYLPIVVGAVGLWMGLRPPAPAAAGAETAGTSRLRETTIFYLILLAVAFWMSLGPDGGLYSVLFYALPVFSFLRAPARVAIVVQLALVVLGGIGLARLLAGRPPRTRALIGAAVLGVLLAEFHQAPIRYRDRPRLEEAYEVLKGLPPGPIAAFPFFHPRSEYPRHTYYMMQSMYHWMPMINGYSDHLPPDFRSLSEHMNHFPTLHGFTMLRRRGVRYLVFHTRLYHRHSLASVTDRLKDYAEFLTPRHIGGDSWLYEITKWPE